MSDVSAIQLAPHDSLCLKTMTGAACEAVRTRSSSTSDASGANTCDTSSFYALLPIAFVLALAGATPVAAQSALARGSAEWTAAAAIAQGIECCNRRAASAMRCRPWRGAACSPTPRGPSWLRGRFEWMVEVSPYFAEWKEGRARGAGVVPLSWRWNLDPRGRWFPYAEVGGGALWTTEPVPKGTTGTNFTTHAGFGARWLAAGGQGLLIGYRLHHISNGNRVARNPGVNAHMLVVGWTGIGR